MALKTTGFSGFILATACSLGLAAHGSQKPQSASYKAAKRVATSSGPHIAINHQFKELMAASAGLDPSDPFLSSDGLHSGMDGPKKLASSECLIAETVLQQANNLDPHAVAEYCQTTSGASAVRFEAVFPPPEGRRAVKLDEALIHIVVWKRGTWTGTWYQYERSANKGRGVLVPFGPVSAVTSPPNHLLAKGGLGFLAIHLNIDDSCDIAYDVKSTHTRPLNQQDFVDLVSLAESYATKGKGAGKGGPRPAASAAIGVWGGELLVGGTVTPATIAFTPTIKAGLTVRPGAERNAIWAVENTCKAAPKPKEPTPAGAKPAEARESGSDPVPGSQNGTVPTIMSTSLRSPTTDQQPSATPGPEAPPNQTDKGGAGKDTGENGALNGSSQPKPSASNILSGGALTVPDEGFYWWDVSVAVPVTSYNKLNFSSVNNLLVVTKTNDIKPYALFDTYFGRADLRLKNAISKPMFTFGIPMSGKPLQKPFVGTGFTIAIGSFRFQPLVGVRVEKDLTTSLTAGSPVTPAMLLQDLHSQWHAKIQAMIGFSVGDAAKVIGMKK